MSGFKIKEGSKLKSYFMKHDSISRISKYLVIPTIHLNAFRIEYNSNIYCKKLVF